MVKLCVQHASREEVAVKLVSKKLSPREAAETEFNLLMSLQHQHLPAAFDLYDLPAYHAVVLEL